MKITANFRAYENGATKGFVDLTMDGSVGIKDARLVEGANGLFLSMPQRKVGEEYRDVVTGVSKEFAAQALEATLAARDSENGHASVGESGHLFYEPHATALNNPDAAVKALASMTVRESKDAEKSAFTINDIRVIQGEKNLFVGMPNVPTGNEEYPYSDLCYFTKGNQDFLNGLIVGKAMDVLGIEKKTALDDKLKDAGSRKDKAQPEKDGKAGKKAKAAKKEKEAERE